MLKHLSLAGAVCAVVLSLSPSGYATPYASGVSNNAGVVTFILNEAADNVSVVFDGGASTQSMGALAAGTHAFNLGTATSFEIVVKKDSSPGYTQGVLNQINSDSNILCRFNNQRGVAVNKNPASPAFGRIYVSVSAAGTSGGRSLTEGIYVLNADSSEVVGLGTNALTAGLDFATGGAESPHRITVGPDDNLYIGDWSDAGGTLFVTDANVASGQNTLPGPQGSGFPVTNRLHGSISGAWIEGSLAAGNLTLYVIDEDLQTNPNSTTGTERNSVWRWDVGAGPFPAAGPPVRLMSPLIGTASQLADLTRGPDGKWYVAQRRAEPANTSGIFVRSDDGVTSLWTSLAATRTLFPGATDLLGETCAVDVSPDGKWMATLRRDTNLIHVLPLVDGLPDITNRVSVMTLPATGLGRDLGFDAAGNLYYVSSGQGLLRVLSPGGNTTATTRSDGTFNVQLIEVPKVSVVVVDSDGAEEGTDSVAFTLTRTGDLTEALTANYTMTGSAQNGSDYGTLSLSVEFPAGEANVTVTVTPIDDNVAEFTESVIFSVAAGLEYTVQTPSTATATIVDNEPATLRLTSGSKTNVFEPLPRDTMSITLSRLGNLAADIFSVELIASGTATDVDDFVFSPNGFAIAPGVVNVPVTISPVNDFLFEGEETVTITIGSGSLDYEIDAQNSVTTRIRDDEYPPAPVLFSENFDAGASNNWQMRFGANNGAFDATVDWVYDYSGLGIGSAPNATDGSTIGLYIAANKADGTASSAGINFYPIGQSFSGDYALRFDMYLSFAGASTTEHALFGLNHSGNATNRATQSPDPGNSTAGGDGFWVGMVTDASNLRDYSGYTYPTPTSLPIVVVNREASTLTSQIPSPPYAFAGSPSSTGNNKSWAEVELKQVNNLITLKVNDLLIWEHQNTNSYTSGNIMIGMNDQFDSIGNILNFVVFDNVRVVSLSTAIEINSVELLANNQIQIDFTSPVGGDPSGYTLQAKGSLIDANWAPDASAAITWLGGTQYRAIATRSGGERYYSVSKP
jgi:hypothetical protein